ncbi:AraC family transcriptional regulator [Hyphococcus lacteus]|uniref:Helix-turn-helix domain-containing protein n=1 Tax=Hyphococcus lacteus TaxID=3143536 RepID=A0ABV3Z2Y0_9PROT
MTDQISVSSSRLEPLIAQARSANVDVLELLSSLDLSPSLLTLTPNERVSLADYYRLQNRLSILFGDETLHLSTRQLLPGSTDFVLQHVHDCKNLFEVMRVIARSYNLLHGGQYNSVVKRRSSVDYVIDDKDFPYSNDQSKEYIFFSIECILVFWHCMLMIVSPLATNAVKNIQVRRPTPGGDCAHLGYWEAPIKFGADAYRISIDPEVAFNPIVIPPAESLSSNAVYQKITSAISQRGGGGKAIKSASSLVRDALSRGVVEQTDVSAQMNISVATLRRRLSEEGTNFRELRREVLNDTAQRLLLSGRAVADVSDALGFSEFRAFNRAFRDWNGLTPKAFLRELGGRISD